MISNTTSPTKEHTVNKSTIEEQNKSNRTKSKTNRLNMLNMLNIVTPLIDVRQLNKFNTNTDKIDCRSVYLNRR